MLKIRDLGISVVPGTMRPPEIGMGAWDPDPCGGSVPDPGPRPCQPPKSNKPRPKAKPGRFTAEAIAELKQQLDTQLD